MTNLKFARYAWGVLAFNLLVIAWGALVRATGSGAGCGDSWPLCKGAVVPAGHGLATMIEFAHRATSGLALIAVVAMAVWAWRVFPRGGPVRRAAVASVIFIFTEAALGAGLVLFRYVEGDKSVARVLYLSAHLVNTLLLLAAIALTAWWGSGRRPAAHRPFRGPLIAAMVLSLSGVVTALADTLFPVTSLLAGVRADFDSSAHFLVRLRIWHPVIAVAVCLYIGYAVAVHAAARQGHAQIIWALLAVQLTAGAVNLWLLAPAWMQMLHLVLADVVWIALVLLAGSVSSSPDA